MLGGRRSVAPVMAPTDVAVYLSVESSLQSAEAMADRVRSDGGTPVLFVEPEIGADARSAFDRVVELPRTRTIDLLTKLTSFVNQSITSMPLGDNELVRERTIRPTNPVGRIAQQAMERVPKVAPTTLNRWNARLTGRIVPNVFGTDSVFAITPVTTPVVLNRHDLAVTVVLDSWDQPVRRTAGFVADRAEAWNLDLADDWRHFQGAGELGTIAAYRLRYALDSSRRRKEFTGGPGDGYVLYPMVTSPNRPGWYHAELRLVAAMLEATERAGVPLLVKPKPNAGPGDLERLVADHPHASVGRYLNTEVTADWKITDDYNLIRLSELDGARCVISTATTFALDAATAGVPILQLDIRDLTELDALAAAAHNSHLVRHLYPRAEAALVRPASLADLVETLSKLDDLEARMAEASDALARWIWHERLPA